MKDIVTNISSEDKMKMKSNKTVISKKLKDYNNGLQLNVTRYHKEKEDNNYFLSSYKCLISPPKILNQSPHIQREENFKDIYEHYRRSNYPLPDNYLKRNMFERSPLLIKDRNELNDYFINERQLRNSVTSRDKVIKTLTRLDNITGQMINSFDHSVDDTLQSERKNFKLGDCSLLNTNGMTYEKKYNLRVHHRLNEAIKQNQKEITLMNNLIINETNNGNNKLNQINPGFHRNKSVFAAMKANGRLSNANGKKYEDNQMTLSKFISKAKEESQSTVSTSHQIKQCNSNEIKLALNNMQLTQSQSHKILANVNQLSPVIKRSNTRKPSVISQSNSVLSRKYNTLNVFKLYPNCNNEYNESSPVSPQNNQTRQINLLYSRVKRENILNPHYKSVDVLDRLFSQFNESPSDVFNSNSVINTMNKMKENILKTNIPYMTKKLQPHGLSEPMENKISLIGKLDKILSNSGRTIIKYFVSAKVGGG